jgi:glutathione S-transferase
MILVGQYDSPFVRRVAVTLNLYAMPFTRDRTSVFSPAIARFHPMMRVPSLILDDGEVLWDSGAILDHLDEQVAPETALTPRSGPARRRVLRATTLATGGMDKAVALLYERVMHPPECVSAQWADRCRAQLDGALARLESEAASPWFFGGAMTQADVTIGCLVGFVRLRFEEAFAAGRYPAIEAIAARCEASDAFVRARPLPDEIIPPKGTAHR